MKRILIAMVVVSFIAGGLAGGAAGVLVRARTPAAPTIESIKTIITEDATISAVKKVSSAVVSIVIKKEVSRATGNFPFDDFFFSEPAPTSGGKVEVGGGSGFIVSADGMIVTNRHVVDDAQAEFTAVLADGRRLPLKVLDIDPIVDIAVAKVEGTNLPVATIGDSDAIQIGETVIAIGNALGEFKNTVTKGVVSGINRRVMAGDNFGASEVIEEAIQTDAAINPGNSGGPLVNLAGEVIGVNVAVSRAAQGVGFAVPANTVRRIVESVKKNGRIVRAWLGVRYGIVDEGARVAEVVAKSPAEKAGLKKDDLVTAVDGKPVNAEHSLGTYIVAKNPGDAITLSVTRAGKTITLRATLEEFKENP